MSFTGLTSSQINYIQEVLGVGTFIFPEGVELGGYQVRGDVNSPLVVLTPAPLESEQMLLQKMLEAIKVEQFCLLTWIGDQPSDIEQKITAKVGLCLGSFSIPQKFKEINWFSTYSLADLLDTSQPHVQQGKKREVWQQLKSISKALKE